MNTFRIFRFGTAELPDFFRGRGRRRPYECKVNGEVKDARLKGKSRRPLQGQLRYTEKLTPGLAGAQQAAPLRMQGKRQNQRRPRQRQKQAAATRSTAVHGKVDARASWGAASGAPTGARSTAPSKTPASRAKAGGRYKGTNEGSGRRIHRMAVCLESLSGGGVVTSHERTA